MRFHRRQFLRDSIPSLVAVCVALAVSGCGGSDGPRTYKVTGPVTFEGEPVAEGRIKFKRATDSKEFSGEIKDGSYEVQSEEGDMTVEIYASRVIPGKFDTTSNPGHKEPVSEMYIPKAYNSASTLKIKVDSSSRSFPFELKKK